MKKWLWLLIIIIIIIQFVPVNRSNPPVESEVPAPEMVKTIFQRACYDCHSHQTRWPWYSYVAPVSFLITHDVAEGRDHLNFSDWDRYDLKKKLKKIDDIVEEIEDGEMPLKEYTWLHPDSKLRKEEIAAIRGWVETYKKELLQSALGREEINSKLQ